jgi:hypothetical protein
VAQLVEDLPSKYKGLSSNSSTANKTKQEKQTVILSVVSNRRVNVFKDGNVFPWVYGKEY